MRTSALQSAEFVSVSVGVYADDSVSECDSMLQYDSTWCDKKQANKEWYFPKIYPRRYHLTVPDKDNSQSNLISFAGRMSR